MTSITSKPMKDLLATRKKQSSQPLTTAIDRYLQSREPDYSRRTDVLHASEIVSKDWCWRSSYHLLRGAKPKKFAHPMRKENIFRNGHDIHAKNQGWMADAGIVKGYWKCRLCEYRTDRMYHGYPEFACPICEYWFWRYDEVDIEIPELRLVGSTDAWAIFPPEDEQEPALVEIKGVGTGIIRMYEPGLLRDKSFEEAFKNISRPFPGHFAQVQVYLEGIYRVYGDEAPDRAILYYENKLTQETKEFIVARDPDLIRKHLDNAATVVAMVEAGEEPDCTVHPGKDCAACKEFVS